MKIFDFEKFSASIFLTLCLMFLKLAGVLTCKVWVIFLPIIILVGWYMLVIWLVGLIVLIYFSSHNNEETDEDKSEDNS